MGYGGPLSDWALARSVSASEEGVSEVGMVLRPGYDRIVLMSTEPMSTMSLVSLKTVDFFQTKVVV